MNKRTDSLSKRVYTYMYVLYMYFQCTHVHVRKYVAITAVNSGGEVNSVDFSQERVYDRYMYVHTCIYVIHLELQYMYM